MAKKLYFEQFVAALDQHAMPILDLADYVEFDPDSVRPRLIFLSDALLDSPDQGYDVDRAVYQYVQEDKKRKRTQIRTFSFSTNRTVVAEGDSWFNLPPFIRPPAIADWIEINDRFDMHNIADWGHTLAEMRNDREHMDEIAEENPNFFMFSGGGNDFQEGLADHGFLHPYDPSRSPDDYLTPAGFNGIAEIGNGYKDIMDEVVSNFPDIKVFCHGYDYPRPLVRRGKYIGRYLRRLGIPEGDMSAIITSIIDVLNTEIMNAIEPYANVQFLDLRGVTDNYTWYDDMHPRREGFKALATEFENAMSTS